MKKLVSMQIGTRIYEVKTSFKVFTHIHTLPDVAIISAIISTLKKGENMAIKNNGVQEGQGQGPVFGAQPEAVQERGPMFSFESGLAFAPISRSPGTETYNALFNAISDLYTKEGNKAVSVTVVKLTKEEYQALNFSYILVAVELKESNYRRVGVYSFLVESTGEKYRPAVKNIANQKPIEIFIPSSAAFNGRYFEIARNHLAKVFQNKEVFFVGETVIPTNFDYKHELAVRELALVAGVAGWTSLAKREPNFYDVNLANFEKDSTLNVDIKFESTQVTDALGNPNRSDIKIDLFSRKNRFQKEMVEINTGDRDAHISSLSGYMDVVWSYQPEQFQNVYQPGQATTQRYTPRLVITNLASHVSYTPASVLFQLLTCMAAIDNLAWMNAFASKQVPGNKFDFTDAGVLNVEANVLKDASGYGQRVDIKASNFGSAELGDYLRMIMYPGVIISLDIPKADLQTWYLKVFALASDGMAVDAMEAKREIIAAADQLTNGNFSKHFNPNQEMFVDKGNIVHLCQWIDEDGVVRDGRSIDHIAMLNWAVNRDDVAIAKDWSDTFTRHDYSQERRLFERKNLIQAFANENVTFRDMAQRVTFTADFLKALMTGAQEAGLSMIVNRPSVYNDFYNQRGVASYTNQAAFSMNLQGVMSSGYGTGASAGNISNLYGISRQY